MAGRDVGMGRSRIGGTWGGPAPRTVPNDGTEMTVNAKAGKDPIWGRYMTKLTERAGTERDLQTAPRVDPISRRGSVRLKLRGCSQRSDPGFMQFLLRILRLEDFRAVASLPPTVFAYLPAAAPIRCLKIIPEVGNRAVRILKTADRITRIAINCRTRIMPSRTDDFTAKCLSPPLSTVPPDIHTAGVTRGS
jgi:hypothetical protein